MRGGKEAKMAAEWRDRQREAYAARKRLKEQEAPYPPYPPDKPAEGTYGNLERSTYPMWRSKVIDSNVTPSHLYTLSSLYFTPVSLETEPEAYYEDTTQEE